MKENSQKRELKQRDHPRKERSAKRGGHPAFSKRKGEKLTLTIEGGGPVSFKRKRGRDEVEKKKGFIGAHKDVGQSVREKDSKTTIK